MWRNLLEPVACLAAREALSRNDPVQAARILLESSRLNHRSCRQLLAEIAPQLMHVAENLLEVNDPSEAMKILELTKQVGTPAEQWRPLAAKCERLLREQQAEARWCDGRVQEARKLAEEGRFVSAIDWIHSVEEISILGHERRDWKKQADRLSDHVRQAEAHLAAGRPAAARACVAKARRMAPDDPRVVELIERLRQAGVVVAQDAERSDGNGRDRGGVTPHGHADENGRRFARPLEFVPATAISRPEERQRNGRTIMNAPSFLLSEGAREALILTRSEISIGSAQGDRADVPLLGRVHDRQCLLVRDGSDVRLMAYSSGLIAVNDRPCRGGETQLIQHDDRIRLEQGRLRFRVLRLDDAEDATVVLIADPTTPVCVASEERGATGARIDRIVLLDRQFVLAPRQPAHWCLPDLPCTSLKLTRNRDRFEAEASHGVAWWEEPDEAVPGNARTLHVEPDLPEAERLAQAWCGAAISDVTLELRTFCGGRR